jgi:hypothetical protein
MSVSVNLLNHEGFNVIGMAWGNLHGRRLIDIEAEKIRMGGRLIIVGGLDRHGSLHADGDGSKHKDAVDIHRVPDMKP